MRWIKDCLISPHKAFRRLSKKPSLWEGATVVLAVAAVRGLANYNYFGKMSLYAVSERMRGLFKPEIGIMIPKQLHYALMIASGLLGVAGLLLRWLLSSAMFHVFSKPFKSEGKFKGILSLSGCALTPLLFQNILRLVDSLTISLDQVVKLETQLRLTQPLTIRILNASTELFNIFGIWTIILSVLAVEENYELPRAKSVIVVVLSYMILLLVSTLSPFL